MIGYIIRRLATAVIVVLGVAAIIFAMLHWLSPTPAYDVLGPKAQPAAVASWNRLHGYDRPETTQFFSYLDNLLHLNFGYSYKLSQSVSALFKENAGRSAYLTGAALLLSLIIAIPLGIAQAVRRNTIEDYTFTTLNLVLYSMPSFFLGLILIQFLALDWGIFPPTVINVASFSRYMRSSALDNLAQDYIRLARAKGLSERAVLFHHLLRNACLPMITLVGLSIPTLLAGNLLTEYLFNYPGLGLLFYTALGTLDYNVLLAYVILGAILTVLGNLVADIAITAADPRVRLE
jgi:peptide/nickel transport system permease protein